MADRSVLIVEDEAIVAADLASKLSNLGFQIAATTATGEEAVAIARERRPALVMMDIRLAGKMSGIEAAERIRRECDLPIVFLTAHSDRATLRSVAGSDRFGFILKPFTEVELETQIAMALYRHDAETKLRRANQDLENARDQLASVNQDLLQANERLEENVAARTRSLEQRTVQLQALAAELTRVEERERNRLATLLHDDIQQLLVGASLRIDGVIRRGRGFSGEADLQRAVNMIGDALSASRLLTAELVPPVLHQTNLAPAVRWLARWYGEKFELRVRVRTAANLDVAPEELRIAVFRAAAELLLNVVRHAEVDVASVIAHRARDGTVRVAVSDRGVGFDPGLIRDNEGTQGGFGLFALRERLEAFGVGLEVRSGSGKGSRIVIVIPREAVILSALAPAAAAAASGVPLAGTERLSRAVRVLVVDDHPIVRESTADLIRGEDDLEVVGQAAGALEAVDLVRRVLPDVVLMDVSMPEIDGVQATRMLTSEFPGVRVIGLSMYNDDMLGGAMRDAGAVECLEKGSLGSQLVATIRRHVRL